MTINPDFKGTPLFDIEYLRNDTRQTRGYCKQLIESGRLCVAQFPIESPDDPVKYDIAYDTD